MPMPDTDSMTFRSQMDALEVQFYEVKDRLQTGYMIRAISEMAEVCPNVASFDLDLERNLLCHNAQDADGNPVNQDMHEALDNVFHYRDEDDYSQYIGRNVVVADVIAHWSQHTN